MKNLFKSVLRSFSKTKVALVSLTFLIFISIGVFSLLNNTSVNFKNSYETLVQKGNLNQFVVNENYDYGHYNFKVTEAGSDSSAPTNSSTSANKSFNVELDETTLNDLVKNIIKANPDEFKGLTTFTVNAPDLAAVQNNQEYIQKISAFHNALVNSKNGKVKSVLDQEKTSYRDYLALDVTDGATQKKLVESNPNDEIDKIILYQGMQMPAPISSDFVNLYLQVRNSGDFSEANLTQTKLIPFYQALANNISPTDEPDFLLNLRTALDDVINKKWTPTGISTLAQFFNGSDPNNNGNKITFSWGIANTNQTTIIDPSAFTTIVAPGNWKYESAEASKEVYDDLNHWKQISDPKNAYNFEANFRMIPEKYKIKIDQTDYLILGVGISPDFMYPIFNTTSLVPNPQSEYLYYVTSSGYTRIRSAFQTNPQESYIVGTFPEGSTPQQQEQIINDINDWSRKNMSWPSGINAAYFANDTTNFLNLNAARTVFIPTLINTISIASLLLTLIVVGLAMFVGIIVVKNYITKNRPTLAILQANGINKLKINLSVLLFSIIPSLVGGIIGYIVGFALQSQAVNIFANYWFMPVTLSSFSVLALFLSILLPLVVFCAASLVVGYFVLRQNVVKSLKDDSDYKVSKFSLLMKAPLAKFGVITRFRSALAFNSFWKLVILCSLSAATMVVFDFALASANTFAVAQNNTKKTHDYNYAIDLATPTEQSGLIKYQAIKDLGHTDPINLLDNTDITTFYQNQDASNSIQNGGMYPSYFLNNKSKIISNWGSQSSSTFKTHWDNIQIFQVSDLVDEQRDLTFINNYVQSKISLNYDLSGGHNVGVNQANPWELSISLMPSNQVSASEAAYQKFLQTILDYNNDRSNFDSEVAWKTDQNENKEFIDQSDSNNLTIKNATTLGSMKPDFLKYLAKQFDRISDKKYPAVDYKLTYNLIGLDENTIYGFENPDQAAIKYGNGFGSPKYSYTRIDGKDDQGKDLKVMGIKNYIDATGAIPQDYLGPILSNDNEQVINYQLFNTTVTNPIIINKFTAEKYNLKVGDSLELTITNSYKRITNKINQAPDPKAIFHVIGINNSAKDDEVYTSYNVANTLLGFTDDEIAKGLPFNGFFSTSLNTFNNTTPLFSESGLYPATSSFGTDMLDKIRDQITFKASYPNGYKALLLALGYTSPTDLDAAHAQSYLDKLVSIYGQIPYTTMINFINSINNNDGLFSTISTTSLTIQNVVIGIVVPIVILIVILISNMLIDELRKIGIRLKALGYSNLKILLSFLSIYIPVFILGLIISIPVSIGLIQSYNQIIFNASNIVLGTSLNPVIAITSLAFLTLVFMVSFISNWISLHRLKIAQEIKNY